MASGEGTTSFNSALSGRHEDSFPQLPRPEFAGPPSIISSRMTDIASEDGGDREAQRGSGIVRRGTVVSDGPSRPGTARTGMSSRSPWTKGPPPLSRGIEKRGSISGSVAGSAAANNRPLSSASRSHVPSLTSHAFFRPMSSQKLQAQRGLTSRPSTRSRPTVAQEPADEESSQTPQRQSPVLRQSLGSNPEILQLAQPADEMQPPPSRGTEVTEQENYDRRTATTSPTHGHYPTASVTDSVRPLQQKKPVDVNLTIDINKIHTTGNSPTPMRTSRSFRSSFLLPSRNEGGGSSPNREMQGGEKLDSVASSPQLPQHAKREPSTKSTVLQRSKAKQGRNWEYFQGNTIFCLGGRFQNTRDRPVNVATGLLVVIPGVLFFAGNAPWIWSNISPAVPITLAYVFYICLSSFLHASSSNPGILPRNLHHFPPTDWNEDPLRLGPPTNDWTLVKSSERTTAAMEVPTKFCKTCNIWRPPRAHHCRLCDNCVETQDHHCVWLNNCIGRRNYRYFFTFVSSATLFGVYLIGVSIAQLVVYMNQQGISFGESVNHFRIALVLIIYCTLFSLYPAALMGYHLFLMARGETTREYLNSHKFIKKDRYRAFTQSSLAKNWLVVLCRPRPPAYLRFKGRYTAGDQRLGARREILRGAAGGRRGMEPKDEGLEMQAVRRPSLPQAESGFQGPVALRNAQQPQEVAV